MSPTYAYANAMKELCKRASPATAEFQALVVAKRTRAANLEQLKHSLDQVEAVNFDIGLANDRLTGLLDSQKEINHEVTQAKLQVELVDEQLLPAKDQLEIRQKMFDDSSCTTIGVALKSHTIRHVNVHLVHSEFLDVRLYTWINYYILYP